MLKLYDKYCMLQLHARKTDTQCFQSPWKTVNVFARKQKPTKSDENVYSVRPPSKILAHIKVELHSICCIWLLSVFACVRKQLRYTVVQ